MTQINVIVRVLTEGAKPYVLTASFEVSTEIACDRAGRFMRSHGVGCLNGYDCVPMDRWGSFREVFNASRPNLDPVLSHAAAVLELRGIVRSMVMGHFRPLMGDGVSFEVIAE